MSSKLKKQAETELEQLRLLLERHQKLLNKCAVEEPGIDEIPALAAVLHAFYTGIENILKRVAKEVDGIVPKGEFWHSLLLDSMTLPGDRRAAVLSSEMSNQLQEYLDFRHVFRHAYTFDLRWLKMKHLVLNMQGILKRFEDESSLYPFPLIIGEHFSGWGPRPPLPAPLRPRHHP